MSIHAMAGQQVPPQMLTNIPRLISAYYTLSPDPGQQEQQVAFGTSGHRGSAWSRSFNQDHILALAQAICEFKQSQGYTGPLYLGKDTHALSEAAFLSALEVFAANKVQVLIQEKMGFTPTPAISQAILEYNRGRDSGLADGVVITPSHNPPEDGGFKYNPPQGGPADTQTTKLIQDRANQLLQDGLQEVRRMPWERALRSGSVQEHDFVRGYVSGLGQVLDMQAIASSGLKIGVDPMGGSGLDYWDVIAEMFGLELEVVNRRIDPAFGFMPLDRDGKIRMDCSSKYAMANLISLKDRFDIAFGNDPDYDRHGIVTRSAGLMNPNHYLAVSAWHLFRTRQDWSQQAAVGKTLVTSSMLDRVAGLLQRDVLEVPVGFKWFVPGLLSGRLGFAAEESAGGSFLRQDQQAWSTDKDGLIMDLLAAEMTAKLGKDPAQIYQELEDRLGVSHYQRLDAPAGPEQKLALCNLDAGDVQGQELAGEEIQAKLTKAPGDQNPIGGLKVCTKNGWFAARPSGTEDIYKIYAESFLSQEHLEQILSQAQQLVDQALQKAKT
ncbi:MAG: phosphoglucomutase (alpha-D-glucose-1,6-bisphosphate-dependent) [Thermodesulfobacteriota bacterium]